MSLNEASYMVGTRELSYARNPKIMGYLKSVKHANYVQKHVLKHSEEIIESTLSETTMQESKETPFVCCGVYTVNEVFNHLQWSWLILMLSREIWRGI